MNNTLYLFVGESGSGKTSIADILEEKYDLTQLRSYTTREPRYDGENCHTFVTNDEFDELEDLMAFTEYNDHRYCATRDQVDNCDIYIVDVPGVDVLLGSYKANRRIIVMYFAASPEVRMQRMLNRGDTIEMANERINNDEQFDWYEQLTKIVNSCGRDNVFMLTIPAFKSKDEVIDFILNNCIYEGE